MALLLAIGSWPGAVPSDEVDPDGDADATLELVCDTVYELEAIKRYEQRAFGRAGLRLPRW
jgi:hypothetical protein